MKKLLIGCIIVSTLFFTGKSTIASALDEQMGQLLMNKVMCCCTNVFGQTCCAWVDFCGGYIPGCLCAN